MTTESYGIKGFRGHRPQERMFSYADKNDLNVYFKLITPRNGHVFFAVKNLEILANFIYKPSNTFIKNTGDNRSAQELFRGSVNFFADVDSKTEVDRDHFEERFAHFLKNVHEEDFKNENVFWSNASRSGKYSYHFKYSGLLRFPTASSQKQFWLNFSPDLSIDLQCYSKNRCLRAVHCFKKGKLD